MTLEVDFSALLQEVAEHPTPDNVGRAFAAALDKRDAAPPTAAASLLPPRNTAITAAIGYPDPPPPPQPVLDPYAPPLESQPETAAEAGPVPSESRLAAAPPVAPSTQQGSVPSPGQKPSALSGEGYSSPTNNGDGAFASQVADALSRLSPNADPELLQAHQRPPAEFADDDSDVTGWILLAGRNAGKTYAGVRELDRQMRRSPNRRARIIAPTFQDAVASCVDGPSGVLQATNNEVVWKPSHPGGAQLRWPNGSICYVIGTPTPREVDRLRAVGNIDFDMFEEAAANTQLLEVERQARLSRRRKGAKWIATTTPRPLPTIRQWQKDPHVAVSSATAHSNRFADTLWLEELERMYAGTRLYAQEVEGRVLEDVEGALWNITHLDRSRVPDLPTFYAMLEAQGRQVSRSAVGVDPAASTGTTGIVAVAMTDDRHLFVVEDASAPGRSAESWARVAVDTALRWNAPIIPENDQGGDMVRAVLKAADLMDEVTILPARARGVGSKGVRAEPIALLWEREDFRGHLVGYFPALETELTSFVPDAPGQDSPDRLDAMVWACTYLWSRASFGDVTSSWPNSAYGKPGAVQMRRPGEVLPWRRSHKSRKETAG